MDEKENKPDTSGICPHHQPLSGSYQAHKKRIQNGLNRIEGQVRGINKMVEEERYCVDVLNQIAAARNALAGLAMLILEDHTKGCVKNAIQDQESEEDTIEELIGVIRNLM